MTLPAATTLSQLARRERTLVLSLWGLASAGFTGACFLTLGASAQGGVALVFAALLLGSLLGAWTGARMSGDVIEPGLVPLGALGQIVVLLHCTLTRGEMIASDALWLGAFAALYLRPQIEVLLERPPPVLRRPLLVWALLLTAGLSLAGLGFGLALAQAELSLAVRAATLVAMQVAVTLFVLTLAPEFLMRLVVWVLVHLLYRLDVRGLEHIPREGAVLLAGNHVSYVDALIIGGVVRRPVRFVMDHRIFRIPGLHFIFRTARTIPIASAKEDPELLQRAMDEIGAALDRGEVVGIFPEGRLTPDGELQVFKPGIEKMLATRPVPVVPMALRGLWQGMWSRRDSRLRRMRLPRRLRARIDLRLGEPMAGATLTAEALQQRVAELRGDSP